MDILFKVLLWLHLMGLVAGSAGGIANSAIGPQIAASTPETRPTLWTLARAMSRTSMMGMGILLVTGPAMVLVRHRDLANINPLFWGKMALVALVLTTFTITVRAAKQAEAGDMAAAARLRKVGPLNGILSLLIVGVSVFTFE